MKKCLLLICATLMTMFVDAQEHVFTDDLVVKVNEDSTPAQSTTVTVTETGNGEYTFSLKNFKLSMGEIELPVGSIILEGVKGEIDAQGVTALTFDESVTIQEGDDPEESWMGPNLGPVPIKMTGKFKDDKLYCDIDINMETLGQVIKVQFGNPFYVFTDDLVVKVNEDSTPAQSTTVTVTETGNGEYTFSLKNFKLSMGEMELPVGSIILEGVKGETDAQGFTTLTFNESVTIQAGDDPEESWMGPNLGPVPIDMTGKFKGDKLYCNIDINMVTLSQVIKVQFGSEFSSIEDVKVSDNGKVDVYTLGGILVRRQVEAASATNDLPQGIYIVNGKKVMVNARR
ncbi:calycin-like domain-containing protein [Coprobacter secundus]|jgi:hypothetical protein|uniref:calycin-like domain-containing protein n=1 Tax=Coprobacter secundus TaxID=1501392 RepID=UPI0009E00913|nr:calycin-like domain-containing protein [Coprobacter secundus]